MPISVSGQSVSGVRNKKFTYSDVPICVNDSFVIQYDQILTLKKYMTEAFKAVLGKNLNYERDFTIVTIGSSLNK